MVKIANTLRRAEFANLEVERRAEERANKRQKTRKIQESRRVTIGLRYQNSPDVFVAQRVYFISAGGKAIKIGYSDDVMSRMWDIQAGNHEKLELLGCRIGDVQEERRLHRQFRQYAIHREWFAQSDEIMDYIRDSCPLGDKTELVVSSGGQPMVVDKTEGAVIRVFDDHPTALEYRSKFDGMYRNLLPMGFIPLVLKKQVA